MQPTPITHPFDQATATRAGYRDISPHDAHQARGHGTARLVDVREASELDADGYIFGAEHVPLAQLDAASRDWNKEDDLILICRSGGRSSRAAEALARRGFRRVMNMAGGMVAYTAAGLPLVKRG